VQTSRQREQVEEDLVVVAFEVGSVVELVVMDYYPYKNYSFLLLLHPFETVAVVAAVVHPSNADLINYIVQVGQVVVVAVAVAAAAAAVVAQNYFHYPDKHLMMVTVAVAFVVAAIVVVVST
jgi:hypothetical protein